ncbi:molybdopterin-dependent oxidoreductase [Youngiibacter multivorans]|uniref:DMSO/TMAO reductase YedYZ molybdopterin-dependent catalytic subunit n=1 Tax=Youngiibacter multivorans TaxID=937251 RepID=A0ABS4G6Q3_9CLOT|nr:molybdopterin-dependent oxidoreductase [Youngiibacter multivorans]MBP1920250.1 DMSO/TMAO reductase YedYZ molybdopterin-dependent catalytic subunit [Youngiibacter multivorans]
MKRIRIAAAAAAVFLLLSACTNKSQEPQEPDVMSKPTEERYVANEIKEYKGARLDPAIGPRDNSIKGIQKVPVEGYSLKIKGLVNQEVAISYDDVLEMEAFEKLIILNCVEGWNATVLWKGVRIKSLIDLAIAKNSANTVIFRCYDGYTTSMPLSTILERDMILAYSSNGVELPPSLGFPFIVVAEDKLGYKWARWVTEIELSDNNTYKGYWENYGYDNNADIK